MSEPDEESLENQDVVVTPETLEDEGEAQEGLVEQNVDLPYGGDLGAWQLRSLMLERPVRTITLFGDIRSGKTTLISELYHAFCNGPFADHFFAGSQTLEGFERRLFPARIESGRDNEDTARTSANKELSYLHLRLSLGGQDRKDFVWTDRAGEDYRSILGATSSEEVPPELLTSDHITFLIDGEKLADRSERANSIERTRQSLRKLIDLNVVGKKHEVSVVTTKADLFQSNDIKPHVEKALAGLRERCSGLNAVLGSLAFFETSVRKASGERHVLPSPHGLDLLLRHWTATAAKVPVKEFQPIARRQIDHLLTRRGSSMGGPKDG